MEWEPPSNPPTETAATSLAAALALLDPMIANAGSRPAACEKAGVRRGDLLRLRDHLYAAETALGSEAK